ncbi:hypothetical protein D3C75_1101680 [compost metagenome]
MLANPTKLVIEKSFENDTMPRPLSDSFASLGITHFSRSDLIPKLSAVSENLPIWPRFFLFRLSLLKGPYFLAPRFPVVQTLSRLPKDLI